MLSSFGGVLMRRLKLWFWVLLLVPSFAFAQSAYEEISTRLVKLEGSKKKTPEDWANLGQCYEALYQNQKAIDALKKALKLSPNDTASRERLIRVLLREENAKEAVSQYKIQIKASPEEPRWPFLLAQLYLSLNQPNEAKKLLVGIQRRSPKSEEATSLASLLEGKAAAPTKEEPTTKLTLEKDLLTQEKTLLQSFAAAPGAESRQALVEFYLLASAPLLEALFGGTPEEKKAARSRLDTMAQLALLPLLESLRDEDEPRRFEVVRLLGYLGRSEAALVLRRELSKADGVYQVRVALSLGMLKEEKSLAPLVERLTFAEEERVRAAAAWALGGLSSPKAAKALIEKGLADYHSKVRGFSALALSSQKSAATIKALRARLSDSSPEVVAACVLSLGVLGAKEASKELSALAASEETASQVREGAARVLASLGEPSSVIVLFRLLWDEDAAFAAYASEALLLFGRPAALPDEALFFGQSEGGRQMELGLYLQQALPAPTLQGDASALLLEHQPEIESELLTALSSSDKQKRYRALFYLDQAEDRLGLGPLIPTKGELGREAKALLVSLGSSASPLLLSLLDDKASEVKIRAISVLGKSKTKEAVAPLVSILEDAAAEQALRGKACIALGQISTPEAIQALQKASTSKEAQLRLLAAEGLGASRDPSVEASLIPLLSDPDPIVQDNALIALYQIGGGTELSSLALEKAAKSKSALIRASLAKALARSKATKAEPLLQALSKDPDAKVASAAKDALRERASPR